MGAAAAARDSAGLPLFASLGPARKGPVDVALEILDRDLHVWEALQRRVAWDPTLAPSGERIATLGRDLRSLRDCCRASHHPRVQRALLVEAGAITRRMRSLAARLQVRGIEIVSVGSPR